MEHGWIKEFMDLFFTDRPKAYKLKSEKIPNKLYKYQPVDPQRIESLKQNKIWFSKATALNDPFDCRSTYFDKGELIATFKKHKLDKISGKTIEELTNGMDEFMDFQRNNIELTCFSEKASNMPMWGNYADNHKGICIEYDFTQLEVENPFSKYLFPVGYESNRYNITNILKGIIENKISHTVYLMFFLMMLKHDSWNYEKEWRIFNLEDHEDNTRKGSLIECPIKPTAIYFGLNCCDEHIETISSIVDKDVTKLHKVQVKNHEFFHLDVV